MSVDEIIELALMSADFRRRYDEKWVTSTKHFTDGIPCRDWIAAFGSDGYGEKFAPTRIHPNRPLGAHRIAWVRAYGRVPYGLQIRHTCDRRRCVEVLHMRLGSNWENSQDMVARGRARNGVTGPLPDTAHPRTGWRRGPRS